MGTTFVLKWGLHPVRLNSVIVSNIAAVRVIYDAETICPWWLLYYVLVIIAFILCTVLT